MNPLMPSSPPDPNLSVWPPPPLGQVQPLVPCSFHCIARRTPSKIGAKACVSDLREGVLHLDAEGIIIQGKAVPRAEIRTWVFVPCFLVNFVLAAIVHSLMEYTFRQEEYFGVRWASIKEIRLVPDKQQMCIVYDAPNYAGKIKTFSLAFTPAPEYYRTLAETAQLYAPENASEGHLKSAMSQPLAWTLVVLFGVVFAFIFWAFSSFSSFP